MFINPMNEFVSILSKNGTKSDLININQLLPIIPSTTLVYWKDKNFAYQGCNTQLLYLGGFDSPEQIIGKRVNQLNISKESSIECESINQMVLETLSTVEKRFPIHFDSDIPSFELNAKVFPVVNHLEKVVGIFGISTYQMIFPDSIHSFFEMITKGKINQLVRFKDYTIRLRGNDISLTKREVIYLLYLMKGRFAKEIAIEMNIRTRTTEDYMQSLKIKMGCYSKSDLISLAFESNLLKILQRSLLDSAKINFDVASNI